MGHLALSPLHLEHYTNVLFAMSIKVSSCSWRKHPKSSKIQDLFNTVTILYLHICPQPMPQLPVRLTLHDDISLCNLHNGLTNTIKYPTMLC